MLLPQAPKTQISWIKNAGFGSGDCAVITKKNKISPSEFALNHLLFANVASIQSLVNY